MASFRKLLLLPASCLVLAGCQGTESTGLTGGAVPVQHTGLFVGTPGNGQPDFEEFEVCKKGSSASFSYSIDNASTGAGVDETGNFSLADGECVVVHLQGANGATVSVTETGTQSGYLLDKVELSQLTASTCSGGTVTTTTQFGSTVSGFISGSTPGTCNGALAVFYNVPEEVNLDGRMTGGGKQITFAGVAVTRGFTIHCDILLSNNLEINWNNGDKWHIDKPLTKATCIDDPNIEPAPPPAPFDTFIGEGFGSYNGVDGAFVKFTFVDAGEPGGKGDMAGIQVWDVNNNLVLDVPLSPLDNGNIQAHYDQPHKNK